MEDLAERAPRIPKGMTDDAKSYLRELGYVD
jgi:hypothetical protein